MSVIASSSVGVSLSSISFAACHLIHRQIMWNIIFFWKKTISASTCSLNLVDSDTVDIGCACGLVHVLQTSHVATMSSTSCITDGG